MVTNAPKSPDYVPSQAPAIKTAGESDRDRVVATIVLAFSSDPAVRWLYPDPHQFLSYFPEFVRAFGGRAFEHGTAHYIGEFTGAALWFPPSVHPDEAAVVSLLERTVPMEMQDAAFGVFEQMAGYHPTEPHWYLPLLGVQPAYQGKGYGSALLRHTLENCDRQHQIAYLESSNALNIPLYERHGFKVLDEIQLESSLMIYPMLRSPR